MRDEGWPRNLELPDMTGDEGYKVGEPQKQALHVAGVERVTQMEKDAIEKEIREKEEAERRQFEKVKDVSETGMSKEDL